MKRAIVSGEYEFAKELEKYGFQLFLTAQNRNIQRPVAYHADMNAAFVNEKLFVCSEQTALQNELSANNISFSVPNFSLKPDYPNDVLLNIAICGKTAIVNKNTVSDCILAQLKDYRKFYVNQGYAGCSTLFINENAVITADNGIYNAIKNDMNVLKILPNGIHLSGYSNGFIGGCAKVIDEKTVLFFGDISALDDYDKIKRFIAQYNMKIKCLSGKLTDIGGMIIF